MAENDLEQSMGRIDAAFQFTALFARAALYAVVYAIADHYACGPAILTGLLLGDLMGNLVSLLWQWRHGLANVLGELALLALVYCWVRGQLAWPEELPLRAILGLCAFGVFAVRVGGSLLVQFGPSDREFA